MNREMKKLLTEVLTKHNATYTFVEQDLVIIWKERNYLFSKGTFQFNFRYINNEGITSAKSVVPKWMKEMTEKLKDLQIFKSRTYHFIDKTEEVIFGDIDPNYTANEIELNGTWYDKGQLEKMTILYMSGIEKVIKTGNGEN